MGRNDQAWAVFWCSLLSPLLLGEIPEAERGAYFRTLAEEERLLPNGQRKRVSVRTLRRWWKRLREEGVEGTFRRRRSDRGRPRTKQQPLLERAVELKKEQPRRSDVVINRILKQEFGRGPAALDALPPSPPGRRHAPQAGCQPAEGSLPLDARPGRSLVGRRLRAWPARVAGGTRRRHSAFRLDRLPQPLYVVEARYYLRENFDVLVDSLLRAWTQHGASRELYVDNAKIYHANALKLACTQLNIKLLHRPPRDPAPGGLIERFFQTLQGQLEAEIRAARLLSLGDINRALQAWLTQEYHAAVHSQTGQPPAERYHQATRFQRTVRLQSVTQLFQRREQRTVHRDHSDVTVEGRYFAVDPQLRGDRLEVRFDPFLTHDQPQEVQLYSTDGRHLGVGRLYQREKGHHPQPPPPADKQPIEPSYLDALEAGRQLSHEQRRQSGLDFHSASHRNVWSLTSFATLIAKLLGRDGGLSALRSDELDALRDFHSRHDRVHESLLRAAVASAESATIPHVLFRLQSLLSQGDT